MPADNSKLSTLSKSESVLWKYMRYSAVLLIPLAWGHVLIQDVLVGGHSINLDYVALRWSMVGGRMYDFLLLAFACEVRQTVSI